MALGCFLLHTDKICFPVSLEVFMESPMRGSTSMFFSLFLIFYFEYKFSAILINWSNACIDYFIDTNTIPSTFLLKVRVLSVADIRNIWHCCFAALPPAVELRKFDLKLFSESLMKQSETFFGALSAGVCCNDRFTNRQCFLFVFFSSSSFCYHSRVWSKRLWFRI